jgi:predicted Fe-Mo cluster-binding NifX family protein
MRIAVTSQNFHTVTGHAGQARRFMVYESYGTGPALEMFRLDLEEAMSFHNLDPLAKHPLDTVDVLITAGAGPGLVRRLAARHVLVVATNETEPQRAVEAFLMGDIKLATEGCRHDEGKHRCACHG